MDPHAAALPDRPEPGAFFDELADRYDATYDGPAGYGLRSRMAAVLALIGAGPGDVLDAGMGAGRLLVELEQRKWAVTGVDASGGMVAAARQRCPQPGHALSRVRSSRFRLPTDRSISSSRPASRVREPRLALREIHRVLRPEGRAIVSYPNPGNFHWVVKDTVWLPFVRVARSILRRPQRPLPQGSPKKAPADFLNLLTPAHLQPDRHVYTSIVVMPRRSTRSFQDDRADRRPSRTTRVSARSTLRRSGGLPRVEASSPASQADGREGACVRLSSGQEVILVTGGSGFVGQHLVAALQASFERAAYASSTRNHRPTGSPTASRERTDRSKVRPTSVPHAAMPTS